MIRGIGIKFSASLTKAPMPRTFATKAVVSKKKSVDKGVESAALQEAVFPPQPAPNVPIPADEMNFVQDTWKLHTARRFNAKRVELSRMENKMQHACLTLEKLSPELFLKATKKTHGDYFPIERRAPLDTPPTRIWNHANDIPGQNKN